MQLYNSLTQKKEIFKTISPNQVLMYVCGITPYDTTHLGHAYLYVYVDALVRYLKSQDFSVLYIQNVTDIDDDILKRAKKENRDWIELGEYWTKKFLADLEFLNVLMPTHYVKATDSVDRMIMIIKNLIKKEVAYEKNGNVYFEVAKYPKYGQLSRFNKEQLLLIAKERGGNIEDANKKDPLDFLLWQKSAKDEPSWESPWGLGRPGWHIECSAMIDEYLGSQIDIHGGGRDLIFPHHESEIAQSESYTNLVPFAGFWLHKSMLMYQGEKMSKSLGNLVMVSDLSKKYSPNAIRWLLLSHHYRTPWEFSFDELDQIQDVTAKIDKTLLENLKNEEDLDDSIVREFNKLMDDDLDIQSALSFISSLVDKKSFRAASHLYTLLGFKL